MITLEEALAVYPHELQALQTEHLPLTAALNRVLAADLQSPIDLPRADQSALDGYALRSADTTSALPSTPVRLNIIAELGAEPIRAPRPELPSGTVARVYTGAWMPPGVDAMVAQERTRTDGNDLVLEAPVAAGANIRRRAEELRAGDVLATQGARLTAGLIAALAAAGIAQVPCVRQPRIAVVVTGSELVGVGDAIGDGEAFDANGPALVTVLRSWGLGVSALRRVRDNPAAIRYAMERALVGVDLLITSGGASVGERDYVRGAAHQLGFTEHFWGVAQKPGKPMFFGTRTDQAILGLPGNPATVVVCAALHLRRMVALLEGERRPGPELLFGQLTQDVKPDRERLSLLRMAWRTSPGGGQVLLDPLPHQASHMLRNLRSANALALVDPGTSMVRAGSVLRWLPLS